MEVWDAGRWLFSSQVNLSDGDLKFKYVYIVNKVNAINEEKPMLNAFWCYPANCQQPWPLPFLADSFFHYLLFAGLQFQERAWFLISGCWTLNSGTICFWDISKITPYHNITVSGSVEIVTVILVCVFWKAISCRMYVFFSVWWFTDYIYDLIWYY